MSFVSIKYVAIESFLRRTACCYSLFYGQKDFLQMAFILRCILCMVTSVLWDEQYMFGVKSFLVAEKVLLMTNDLAAKLWRWQTHRSQQSILSMNLDDVLKNETLIWTFKLFKHLFVKLVYNFLFLSFNMLMFNKRVVNEICWENIALTDCVLSTTDVTIMTSSSWKFHKMSPMKFLTKRIFRIFCILKIDRITSFCYLFMIRPSYYYQFTTTNTNTATTTIRHPQPTRWVSWKSLHNCLSDL